MKRDRGKEKIIEQLKKIPIVQVVCERSGVSRATYYRWCKEDEEFKKATEAAMAEGELLINDMSESQILAMIRDKHWPAISFWLKHHHPRYANRVEITARQIIEEKLSPEQEEIVQRALELASFAEETNNLTSEHEPGESEK